MVLQFSNTVEETINGIENEVNGPLTGNTGGPNTGGSGSNASTTTQNLGDRIIDASLSPFARRIWIIVEGKNLRPDTDYYRFYWGEDNALDDLDVEIAFSNHTLDDGTPIGTSENWDQWKGSVVVDGTLTQPNIQFVKTDSNGYFKCAVRVPENTSIGVHNLQIDEEGENYGIGGKDSKANALFQSHGLEYTSEATILTTEVVEIPDNTVEPPRFDEPPQIPGTFQVDPLAQSFFTANESVYVSSIDLYVRTKATDNNLVVQFREMINGYPGPKIIPGSTVVLTPSDITTSTDGQTATKCSFTDPVYLKANTEYCFVEN